MPVIKSLVNYAGKKVGEEFSTTPQMAKILVGLKRAEYLTKDMVASQAPAPLPIVPQPPVAPAPPPPPAPEAPLVPEPVVVPPPAPAAVPDAPKTAVPVAPKPVVAKKQKSQEEPK